MKAMAGVAAVVAVVIGLAAVVQAAGAQREGAKAPPSVAGQAVDAAGKAVVGAYVTVTLEGRVTNTPVATATTDREGRFSFVGLREGDYIVRVRSTDAKLEVVRTVTVVNGNTANLGKLTLRPRRAR